MNTECMKIRRIFVSIIFFAYYHIDMQLFIFDLGNVIINHVNVLPEMADVLGIPGKELEEDYMIYDTPLMDGYMSASSYYDHLERKFGISHIATDIFADLFCPTVNTFMLGIVDALREHGYRCVIGSNTFEPHSRIVESFSPSILSHFDHYYASHKMHLSKPEKAFFLSIAKSEGYDPSSISFTDDLERNIDAARSLGIDCLHYKGDGKDGRAREFFSRFISL